MLYFLHQDPVKFFGSISLDPGAVPAFLQKDEPEVFKFLRKRDLYPVKWVRIIITVNCHHRAGYLPCHIEKRFFTAEFARIIPDPPEDIILAIKRFVFHCLGGITICMGKQVSQPGKKSIPVPLLSFCRRCLKMRQECL